MEKVTFEKITYAGWPNCYRLANATIEIVATADVGPRLIRCGFVGRENMFGAYEEHLGQTGGEEWRIYGGHRLWHAPEEKPRTYFPDNAPVAIEAVPQGMRLRQEVEPTTGIEKEMVVEITGTAGVRVTHRLWNRTSWPLRLAPWALSVMNTGGTAILPLPARVTHLQDMLPRSTLTLWGYTDMADPRWTWGKTYILLRQDAAATTPQKVGATIPDGWAAYARNGELFLKTFKPAPGADYPDSNCHVETFTNERMLELETLAPFTVAQPGNAAEHVEQWYLLDGMPAPDSDAEVQDIRTRVEAHLRA